MSNERTEKYPDIDPSEDLISIDHAIKEGDLVHLLFGEIRKTPLLTPEEEKDLATRMREGRRAEEIRNNSNKLKKGEKQRLESIVQEGKQAEEKMIKANMRLVVSIAKKYRGRGVPFLDLIQEGACGLMRANEKFDIDKGYKYSTYATWWVRQAITRTIADTGRTIRLPVHLHEEIQRLLRIETELMQELGRNPTNKEIADRRGLPEEKVAKMFGVSYRTLSLEQPVSDGGEEGRTSELGDFIRDEDAASLLDLVSQNELRERLKEAIRENLDPREAKILEFRFGLKAKEHHTCREVGDKFELSRERIRQIEARAIRKLRNQLHDFSRS